MKDEFEEDDMMTGIPAQEDPEFHEDGIRDELDQQAADEAAVMSGTSPLDDLEAGLQDMEKFEDETDLNSLANYDNFIVLPKRELMYFLRAVEPLTKSTVDQYGKAVRIVCVDKDTVELRYTNKPHRVVMSVPNKSQKEVNSFCIYISLLKRLVVDAYSSIVFVEKDGEYSIAICDSLLFIETVPLMSQEYEIERLSTKLSIDRELGLYNFKKIGAVFNCANRQSEKVIVVKNDKCYFNTGVFSACVRTPFQEEHQFLLYKSNVDLLGTLLELSKLDIRYSLYDSEEGKKMVVTTDNNIYCELPIQEKIEEHFSSAVARSLTFNADITVVNDSLSRLFGLVKSLDYLSDIVSIIFTDSELIIRISNKTMTRHSDYKFMIAEGKPEITGEMKVSSQVMTVYINSLGSNVRYLFNDSGLCMSNDNGNYIIRKTN